MSNWITEYREPKKLFLAWQGPESNRYRWAVAEVLADAAGSLTLRYFQPGPEFEGLNNGHAYSELQGLGFNGHPAFKLGPAMHSHGVAEVLLSRLPPVDRPDFPEYLTRFRLRPGKDLTPLKLLAITGARLPSDGFSLVDPFDPEADSYDLMLEAAGNRHIPADQRPPLVEGQQVDLSAEPGNTHDPGAVMFTVRGEKIGYVNRLQAPAVRQWLRTHAISAMIERLNGQPERPRVHVFLKIRSLRDVAA